MLEQDEAIKAIECKGANNKLQHQQSLQSNKQDLDQSVELDVKPRQFNVQSIDLTINNKIDNYSGKIIGSAIKETEGQLLAGFDKQKT